MAEFLRQVARHYLSGQGHVSSFCFVFPNRRSMAFFRKYLAEEAHVAVPFLMPLMMPINDFFYQMTGEKTGDRVTLLVELYKCYSLLNPKAESLDEFIHWGDVLLGDFNDVDKYLVDAAQLFRNISDLKEIQDSYSYLTPVQREAMESFMRGFRSFRPDAEPASETQHSADVRNSFVSMWNMLLPLYESFRSSLKEKGMSYEGMVYRSLAESASTPQFASQIVSQRFPEGTRFVFVGLNVLTPCEEKVMKALKDASLAEFCWDCGSPMLMDPHNKASFFMKRVIPGLGTVGNLSVFGQAFEPEPVDDSSREVNVVSVPSATGQAKLLPQILSRIPEGEREIDTAVVLPDEGLLIPVLNSVPDTVRSINVTMGYPISSGEFWAFMNDVQKMQLSLRQKAGKWHFYHKNVWNILQGGIARTIMTNEEQDAALLLKKAAKFYIPEEDFAPLGALASIFRPVAVKDADTSSIARYLSDIVSLVAGRMKDSPEMFLELDFAKEYWRCIARLDKMKLSVQPSTWFHLLQQLLSGVSVPFQGEPLQGLQVMGPLETRALDFKNVIIMSSNDGTFPRRSVSSSFVPPELRRGFGLPTYELQDSMWAYYFYRMIARATRVWMLYDSRTEGTSSGEESRFIKQLRYHFGCKINDILAEASPSARQSETIIHKTPEHIEAIRSIVLSASSLHNYLECPAKFYYSKVLGLKVEDEVSETMDAGMIGNVWHNTMCALLCGEEAMLSDKPFDKRQGGMTINHMEYLTIDYLKEWAGRKDDIHRRVLSFIRHELNSVEPGGKDLVNAGVITRYVMQTISRDIEMLKARGLTRFRILGLEKKLDTKIGGFRFIGYIDRLDSLEDGMVRVCDYKSGSDSPSQLDPDGRKDVGKFVESVLSGKYDKKASLQFMLYDLMVREYMSSSNVREHMTQSNVMVYNTMYAVTDLFKSPVEAYREEMGQSEALKAGIEEKLRELTDPLVDFERCESEENCKYCDFKTICGK